MALTVGMLLGSSGGVMQTVFRNPIADPYIIGISASATFGAVVAYFLKLPESFYGIFGSVFSFITASIIFKLSETRRPGAGLSTLLVIGIAISAFIRALISLSMYIMGEDSFRIILWTMGYLGRGSWREILILVVPLVGSLLYFHHHRFHLDALLLEEAEAHSLGINVKKFRREVLIVATFMVGFSVAFSGMIGFVGLIIPHIVRTIFGNTNTKVIPLSALYGGIFLLVCDTLARGISPSMEIPIGIITAIFGAPFFLYLSFKMRRRGI
ncbi:MAG: iron ABC transporter permease [Cetobacterium sp.]